MEGRLLSPADALLFALVGGAAFAGTLAVIFLAAVAIVDRVERPRLDRFGNRTGRSRT